MDKLRERLPLLRTEDARLVDRQISNSVTVHKRRHRRYSTKGLVIYTGAAKSPTEHLAPRAKRSPITTSLIFPAVQVLPDRSPETIPEFSKIREPSIKQET